MLEHFFQVLLCLQEFIWLSLTTQDFKREFFSIAGIAQSKNQCNMNQELLEMRTLLCVNKDLIKRMIIKMVPSLKRKREEE